MPIRPEREYRSMELRSIEKNRKGEYVVEGYATTFDSPYELYRDGKYIVKEQVSRNAFDGTDMGDVIFQLNHEGNVFARTRNNSLTLEMDDHGLKTIANLGLTTQSREIWEGINTGLLDRMSFAFTVTEDSFDEEDQGDGTIVLTRSILRIGKLYDVSVVSMPANEQTSISARSKFDGVIEQFEAERLQAQKDKEERQALKDQISRILEVSND